MINQLRPAFTLLALLTLLTGVAYPLAMFGLAQIIFPYQANGSLIRQRHEIRGAEIIGQSFADPGHFWGRPSATQPSPYNAASSSGSNVGPTNRALKDSVRARVKALQAADPGNRQPTPADLVTASASGLDPHISPAAARYQVSRVARERHLRETEVTALVNACTEGRQFGFLGEPRVNVLRLNLALDKTYLLRGIGK